MSATIILGLAAMLSGELKGLPGMTGRVGTTISTVDSGIVSILASLTANGTSAPALNPATILTAIQALVATLKTDTNLPAGTLSIVNSVDASLQKAMAEDKIATVLVDVSTLTPIATV